MLSKIDCSIILFSSPRKFLKNLEKFQEYFSDRELVICREITKLHEEYIRDKVKNRQYIRRMFAEFRKCNIQCTNCHNIETHENGEHNGRSSKNKTRFSKLTPPPTVGTLETFL